MSLLDPLAKFFRHAQQAHSVGGVYNPDVLTNEQLYRERERLENLLPSVGGDYAVRMAERIVHIGQMLDSRRLF